MRSERVPFTDGETPFPNLTQDSLSSYDGSEDACGDSVTTGGVGDAVHGVSEDADDDLRSPMDSVVGDVTDVRSDDNWCDDGHGDDIDILYKGEGSESICDDLGSAVTDPPSSYMVDVLPEGIEVIDGIAYIRQEPNVRRQVLVRVNRAFKDRLKVIAVLERRDLTAVVEEAIRIFMSEPVREPRPYLPEEFDETQTCRLTFYMNSDDEEPLRERARIERREVMDLVRRALVDYAEASLFDPKPRTSPSHPDGMHGNGHRRDDSSSEVSQYLLDDEGRLSPSEAQQTGRLDPDGVI